MSYPAHLHVYQWGPLCFWINDETGTIGFHWKIFPGKQFKSSGRWSYHSWGEVSDEVKD